MSKLKNKRQLKTVLLDLIERCDSDPSACQLLQQISDIIGLEDTPTPTLKKATYSFSKDKLKISQHNETHSLYVQKHMINRVTASIDLYNKSDIVLPMQLIVPYSLIKNYYDADTNTIAGIKIDSEAGQRLLQLVVTNWDSSVINILFSDNKGKLMMLLNNNAIELSNVVFLPDTCELVCYMESLVDRRGDRLSINKGKVTIPSMLLPLGRLHDSFTNYIIVKTTQDGFPVRVHLNDILNVEDDGLIVSSISL